jgi:hypothetical protein
MKPHVWIEIAVVLCACAANCPAQSGSDADSRREVRSSLSVINDATTLSGLTVPIPKFENRLLIEPAFSMRYDSRWSLASSVVGVADTDGATHTSLRVKETYVGLSAGDFDFTLGRKLVRWGTGYAFTAAGVLDPPRDPTNPTDRLNLNEGRDMVKADWVHGPHALSLAWATDALTRNQPNLHDTTALRYNVLVHGFDTSLIAGKDRGGDAFGALTFTRVLGQAWELHGEAAWREQGAALIGGKYTTHSGVTFIGEFYTPPNIAYFRDSTVSPLAGRQHYAFFNAGKSRLRELPGWKEWDLSGTIVTNLNDHSFTAFVDANRRFGNHFSTYLHLELPRGSRTSDYGATPYTASTSAGIRFQL